MSNSPRLLKGLSTIPKKMPELTLYGANGSSNTDRVRLVLAEAGIKGYTMKLLNLSTGEAKSAENLARNPFGKIPILVTSTGFTLYESRAICRYLARKHAPHLLPSTSSSSSSSSSPSSSDMDAEARFEQALDVEGFYFNVPAGQISFETFAKPRFLGLPTDESVVAGAVKALESYFDVAEGLLSGRGYMAGDEFSLADVYHVPLMQRLFDCGYGGLVTRRRNVADWWEKCRMRPAVKGMLDR